MSSTTGVQNLLVNTFRPVYAYDATATLYTVKLDTSNVNTYYGNSANVLWAQVGDSASNVYVGKDAGNDPTITVRACSNVTALGYAAANAISNVSNSVFVGTSAGLGTQSVSNIVSVGFQSGTGTASVRVGAGTSGVGSSNTVLGTASTTGSYSNCILVGPGLTADKSWRFRVGTSAAPYIVGDISTGWVGIGTATPNTIYTKLDVAGDEYVGGNLGVNTTPGYRTLDVNGNFRAQDASSNTLDFSNGNFSVQKGTETLSFSNSALLVRDTSLNTISYVGGLLTITDASSAEFDLSAGKTRSSGGFYSKTGIASVTGGGAATTLGAINAGLILVSANAQTNPNTDSLGYVLLASTTSNIYTLSSYRIDTNASITASGTNLVLSNTTDSKIYYYTITYFPIRP